MDVTQTFNEVLSKIEQSTLNYIIHHKTPFSAQISLKRSFVKYFDAGPSVVVANRDKNRIKDEPSDVKSEVTKDLEVAKLKITQLENILEKERSTVKALQGELGNHRDEALNLKREKKELKANLDEKENKWILLQKDHAKLCEESVKNDNLLTEQTKVLNTKISEFENIRKEI